MTAMPTFELTTNIGRACDLDDTWLQYYDSVYLGDPFCKLMQPNLLNDPDGLKAAIERIKAAGKKVYVTTDVEPWTDDLVRIRDYVAAAVKWGVDAVEVLNEGVLFMVAQNHPGVSLHINGFVRANNAGVAKVFKEYHATRLSPYYELSLEEIAQIKKGAAIAVELVVHGQIPLGFSEFCSLHRDKVAQGSPCGGDCYDNYILRHQQHDLSLRSAGRVMMSGKEVCMLPHLGDLINGGFQIFRVESRLRDNTYREHIGRIYREALSRFPAKTGAGPLPAPVMSQNREGFCNGYYFGRPGQEFVGN